MSEVFDGKNWIPDIPVLASNTPDFSTGLSLFVPAVQDNTKLTIEYNRVQFEKREEGIVGTGGSNGGEFGNTKSTGSENLQEDVADLDDFVELIRRRQQEKQAVTKEQIKNRVILDGYKVVGYCIYCPRKGYKEDTLGHEKENQYWHNRNRPFLPDARKGKYCDEIEIVIDEN